MGDRVSRPTGLPGRSKGCAAEGGTTKAGKGIVRRVGVLCVVGSVGCGGLANHDDPESVGPLIEVARVREGPGSSLRAVEYDGETRYLESEPVLSDPDFAEVEPVIRPGQLHLEFELRPEAGDRIASFTRASIGESLAVVVDSEVRSVSVILGVLGPRGRTSIEVTPEEAEDLAAKVRARWPPPG